MKKRISKHKIFTWYNFFIPCVMLIFNLSDLRSQQVILAGGGNINNSTGSLAYSIGQVAYGVNNSSRIIEGIQIPYEIYVVTGIEMEKLPINLIKVYPNPVINDLTIFIEDQEIINYSYQIYDENGKLIINGKILTNQQDFTFQNLKSGIFFLNVLKSNKIVKTFKIIKH